MTNPYRGRWRGRPVVAAKAWLTVVGIQGGVSCSIGIGWIDRTDGVIGLRLRVVCVWVMSWVVYRWLRVPRGESSLFRLIMREGYVRILIHRGRQALRVTIVCGMGVHVSPVCHIRGWWEAIILPFYRQPHVRRLCLFRGFNTGPAMVPSKLHLGLLWNVSGWGPARTTTIGRGLWAAARTMELLSLPVAW